MLVRWAGVSLLLVACSDVGCGDGLEPAGGAGADAGSQADAASPPGPRATFPTYPDTPYPRGNPHGDAKALLGKALFWDEQLSSDDSTACGSCHRPSHGGSDPRARTARHPGADGELGSDDDPHGGVGLARCVTTGGGAVEPVEHAAFGSGPQVGRRKPPSALDAMHAPFLFVDGRAGFELFDPLEPGRLVLAGNAALENQALAPILDASEMACEGRSWQQVTDKLARVAPLALASELPAELARALSDADYPLLFQRAFGDDGITPVRIALAIATYERTLRSDATPYDRFAGGDDDALTSRQRRGLELFVGELFCTRCHQPPLFTNHGFHDLGMREEVWDPGLFERTGVERQRGLFRTPGLRNVGLRERSGLLHDGLGGDLGELLERYAESPALSPNTSPWLRPFELGDGEREAVLDFLRNALTDPRVEREQPPFDRPRLASER